MQRGQAGDANRSRTYPAQHFDGGDTVTYSQAVKRAIQAAADAAGAAYAAYAESLQFSADICRKYIRVEAAQS